MPKVPQLTLKELILILKGRQLSQLLLMNQLVLQQLFLSFHNLLLAFNPQLPLREYLFYRGRPLLREYPLTNRADLSPDRHLLSFNLLLSKDLLPPSQQMIPPLLLHRLMLEQIELPPWNCFPLFTRFLLPNRLLQKRKAADSDAAVILDWCSFVVSFLMVFPKQMLS